MARSRTLVLIGSVVGLLAAFPATGAADPPVESYRFHGASAWGMWDYCIAGKCGSMDLYAFQGLRKDMDETFKGTMVCVSIIHTEGGFGAASSRPPPDETGCAAASKKTLRVTNDLSLATLAPTTVKLRRCRYDRREGYICDRNSRSITVAARWRGTGTPYEDSARYRSKSGTCTETYRARGTFRSARARASLDGIVLGQGWEPEISKEMWRIRSTCEY